MDSSTTQYIRFRRPEPKKQTPNPPRHTGILQDQLRRAQRRPWSPSFSFAVRVILLVRVAGAMYSGIADCDEVFNFWEPLHFWDRGYGFQTWEVSPQFAIRSWAYVLLHVLPIRITRYAFGVEKRPAFFAVRMLLALTCTLAEAKFYRTVYEKINERVGRYLFFMLLFSAGIWHASVAFLPSSFAMYMNMFAFSYALDPPSIKNNQRTIMATLCFATGAIVGWPFALALAIPFVLEELFVYGADRVLPENRPSWLLKRWMRLLGAGMSASLLFVPVIGLDTLVYGKVTVVPWNIVRYNIFGDSKRGPDLFGTSPWSFYFLNLVLNFNILFPLSLLGLPALAVTYVVDRKRLGFFTPSPDQSSPFTILGLRLLPFYLWLGILTFQAHKEERFMFPAYPMLCFNAAVTLYLMRGWQEAVFIKLTKSPYQASRSSIFRNSTLSAIVCMALLSISRILALRNYYYTPLTVAYYFETEELPRLLNATGLLPIYPPNTPEEDMPRIDLSPIRQFDLKLCWSKEWHRFPGHYLIPDGVAVVFVKSEFDGLLPGHFMNLSSDSRISPDGWSRPGTRHIPEGMNDLNQEQRAHYVDIRECDYLVDLDFPLHPISSPLEPRYAVDETVWERVFCGPFLDARHSRLFTRVLWVPGEVWQSSNEFGDYCLLKNKALVRAKEIDVTRRIQEGSF